MKTSIKKSLYSIRAAILLTGAALIPFDAFASEPEVDVSADIYVGFHMTTPEDDDLGFTTRTMDYNTWLFIEGTQEVGGWTGVGYMEIDLFDAAAEPYETYIGLSKGIFGIRAGLIDLGGNPFPDILAGNVYTTVMGASYAGQYGNNQGAAPRLVVDLTPADGLEISLGYNAGVADVSFQETEDEGNVSVLDLMLKFTSGPMYLGLAYESQSYEDNNLNENEAGEENDVWGTEAWTGLGIGFTIAHKFTPFINYGTSTVNDPNDEGESIEGTELNIGIDATVTETIGLTLAAETLTSNEELGNGDEIEDITNVYGTISVGIGPATVYASYWTSDQKVEDGGGNVASQVDFELAYSF